jgi:hypothetical protein
MLSHAATIARRAEAKEAVASERTDTPPLREGGSSTYPVGDTRGGRGAAKALKKNKSISTENVLNPTSNFIDLPLVKVDS